ncbi:hypothetical protein SARC_00339 [Sphaeroforma arctica JP610]|uniref:Uncharacterized protein n=1 Tax=Sphaeroforma arctica JP610 TaxID=667725 RepID=A0A0L0GEY4_9EUKA|nr:hypothetical protein SARC_00339 [Sphaeroforma arctica JP610]KNC87575.1 hypothetical protein SARC_00339 [Sphaeroforma arctica JP610]|eukprot:XP_014161477.1 hypothetical protein SARC_00339 [Sphaeroforma arctica JP610]
MGDLVVSATSTLKTSQSTVSKESTLVAFAVRQMPRKRENHNTPCDVLRFMCVDYPKTVSLKNTFVAVKRPRPSAAIITSTLFWPEAGLDRSKEIVELETRLLRTIIILTVSQRCNDWFNLRQLLITGTVGQTLALKDVDARKFISSRAFVPGTAENNDDEDSDEPFTAQVRRLEGVCVQKLCSNCIHTSTVNAGRRIDEDGFMDQYACLDIRSDDEEENNYPSLAIDQEFVEKDSSVDNSQLVSHTTKTTDAELTTVAIWLVDSWYGRHFSTDAMKEGTNNEPFIMALLSKDKLVHGIYYIGLVCMKQYSWIWAK